MEGESFEGFQACDIFRYVLQVEVNLKHDANSHGKEVVFISNLGSRNKFWQEFDIFSTVTNKVNLKIIVYFFLEFREEHHLGNVRQF